jgi:tetratricopeptide (TPR) repeat protein
MSDPNDADDLLTRAREALDGGRFAEGEALQRQAVEILRSRAPKDKQLLKELETRAGIHYIQEKFDFAESEYGETLSLGGEFRQESDPATLQLLNSLAKSQFKQQKYDLAESTLRRALLSAEGRKTLEKEMAQILHHLGYVLYYVGKYQEAEPFLLKALQANENRDEKDASEVVGILERLALTYANCPGIGKDPMPYFRKAIQTIKPEGEFREQYAQTMCRFASYAAGQKDYEEADALYSELLAILSEPLSVDKLTAQWLDGACVNYFQSRGRPELVAALMEKMAGYDVYGAMLHQQLEHAEQTLSENDPNFAEAAFNTGNNEIFRGNYDEARKHLQRALDAYEGIYGEESEEVVKALARICLADRMLKKFDEAERAIAQAIDISRRQFADRYISAWAIENFALLREAEGRIDEATQLYAESLKEYERICGFPSYGAVEALFHQSSYFLRREDFAAAEKAIRRVTSVMDKIDSISDYEKADYLGVLAFALEGNNQKAEAEETRRRSEELLERARRASESESKS